jgi:SAM-dependent methyltransferase
MTETAFDGFASSYSDDVRASIGFSGVKYDFFTHAKVDILLDLIKSKVGDPRSAAILDVGCGPGITGQVLNGRVGRITGVDTSPAMVDQATRRNPGFEYVAYGGERLPFADRSYDVTFAICVMHHVPPDHWDSFVSELHRVTRRGGMVAVFEHNPFHPLTRRAVDRCPFDEDAVLLRRSRVASAMRNAGGTVCASRYVIFVPIGGRHTRRLERLLGRLPAGSQHVVASTVG